MIKNINDKNIPSFLKDYLNYMQTIKGKSTNTVLVYFYDLRVFLRFLKLHKNTIPKSAEFEKLISQILISRLSKLLR